LKTALNLLAQDIGELVRLVMVIAKKTRGRNGEEISSYARLSRKTQYLFMKLKRRHILSFVLASGGGVGLNFVKKLSLLNTYNRRLFAQKTFAFQLIEDLGQPCRDKQILAGTVVTDRLNGRELLALTNMNEISQMELIFVDLVQNTGKVVTCPNGSGAWAFKEVPGNKLVIGTFYDGKLMVFDLQKMEFITSIDVPGESYIWNLAVGSDGRIYGGTYPGAKLVAFDLNNYTVEDCGTPVLPNLYLRFVSTTPDGRVLCSFRTQKTTTRLYDPIKKEFELVPKQLENIHRGVSWNDYFLAESQVFEGKSLEVLKDYPFPAPPSEQGAWQVDVELTNPRQLFLRQGKNLYGYTHGDEALTLYSDIDLRGGKPLTVHENGAVLGVRGQDYFVLNPKNSISRKRIPVNSNPRPIAFLKVDPLNRIWVGSPIGSTIFCVDSQNQKTTEISDVGRQVGDVTFLNSKIYAASYSAGDITEYNPNEKWDEWNGTNPRLIATVGSAYIRPTGGIVSARNGLLYSGWMARYAKYGGAVAITNPDRNGATEILENPLGQQAIAGLAVDRRFIYVGTSIRGNGLPLKNGESAKFGMIDLNSKKLLFSHTFEKAVQVGAIVYETQTDIVAMVVTRQIHIFNPNTKQFLTNLFTEVPEVTSNSLASGENGIIYYGSQNSLWSINLQSAKLEKIIEMPSSISHITTSKNEMIYVACGANLFKVRIH
jgi:outer membrane protein assembly factor BamB